MKLGFLLLSITLAGAMQSAAQPTPRPPLNFSMDIAGILTKRGCNSSGCHGGVKGRGGLKLSLDGLDPREDHRWIVQGGMYQVLRPEALAPIVPRISTKEPEKSLLLLKPTMSMPHGGGKIFTQDSSDYQTILTWIRQGAPYGADEWQRVKAIEVQPAEIVLEPRSTHQLTVKALDDAGRSENITSSVRYESLNSDVVAVAPDGRLTAKQIGETSIIVRSVGRASTTRVGVIAKRLEHYPQIQGVNFIDEFVLGKLHRLHMVPSELSGDAEFLRRICLDLTGTLPPPARVREFVESRDPAKRAKLIETLLASPEYVEFWTFRFADLFRVRGDYSWLAPYWDWVRASVAANAPWDRMAREAIAAQGPMGASHLHMIGTNKPYPPEQILNETIRVFLGRRLDCAQCHNHPFDRWTQNQYWSLAAFFGRMTNTGWGFDNALFDDVNGHEEDYTENNTAVTFRKVVHPRTRQLAQPAFLDGAVLPENRRDDLRLELAKWMTAHPYFAEEAVNRMWGYFFGRGLVDPVDDFRLSNPATHPELLQALAKDFRENGHDWKKLISLIVSSRTYQVSSRANETNRADVINYSHSLARPLDAEVLLDAISQVAEQPESFGDLPPGTRAIHLRFPAAYPSTFLDVFDRPRRDVVPERSGKVNLAQALHTMVGTTFSSKLATEGGRVDRLASSGASDREIVEELYLAALSRPPAENELEAFQKLLQGRPRKEAVEDLAWAILASREFGENH